MKNKQKAYNTKMENIELLGTKKAKHKKYKQIADEMGARLITLDDVANGLEGKKKGFLDMMDKTGMTMDELVVMQQYAKAIIDQDTKSAEFIRDTKGEKPSTVLDVKDNTSGISKLTDDELRDLIAELKEVNKNNG